MQGSLVKLKRKNTLTKHHINPHGTLTGELGNNIRFSPNDHPVNEAQQVQGEQVVHQAIPATSPKRDIDQPTKMFSPNVEWAVVDFDSVALFLGPALLVGFLVFLDSLSNIV